MLHIWSALSKCKLPFRNNVPSSSDMLEQITVVHNVIHMLLEGADILKMHNVVDMLLERAESKRGARCDMYPVCMYVYGEHIHVVEESYVGRESPFFLGCTCVLVPTPPIDRRRRVDDERGKMTRQERRTETGTKQRTRGTTRRKITRETERKQD